MDSHRPHSETIVSVRRSGARVTVEAGSAAWPFRPDELAGAIEFARNVARLLGGRVIPDLAETPKRRAKPVGRRHRKRSSFAAGIARSCGPQLWRQRWTAAP